MSSMRGYRKNSLVIDFTVLPAKPSVPEVRNFVFDFLKLDIKHIKNIQLFIQKSYVFIELVPEFAAEDVVSKCSRKFCMTTADGLQKAIPLFLADGAVEIKIFDLPPYLPNATIANSLAKYGDVLSIRDESWHDFFPGVSSGTRIARMRLKEPIPSYIAIEDMTAFVRYRNQTPTCKHCARHLHLGKKCSEIKKALEDGASSGLTLAEVMRGVNPEDKSADTEQSTVPAQAGPQPTIPVLPFEIPLPDEVNVDDNDDAQSVSSKASEEFIISEEEDAEASGAEKTANDEMDVNTANEKMPVDASNEEMLTPSSSSETNNPKPNLRSQSKSQETRSSNGKRLASPKGNKEKRPSRSSTRK